MLHAKRLALLVVPAPKNVNESSPSGRGPALIGNQADGMIVFNFDKRETYHGNTKAMFTV